MSSIKKKCKTKKKINYKTLKPNIIDINGYSVLLLPIKNSKIIRAECLLFGGSIIENKQNTGISHLLEHIIMDSWDKCKQKSCSFFWEKYGTFSNAFTGDTYLHFWKQGLSSNIDLIIDYLISIIISPIFSKEIIDAEKKAIINELNGFINDPSWRLWDSIYKNAYNDEGIKYGKDWNYQLDILKNIDKNKLTKFYKKYFNQKRILFIITGEFNKNEIIKLLKKKLITNSPPKQIVLNNCFTYNKKVIFVENKKAKNTDIVLFFPISIRMGDKNYPYLSAFSRLIGGDLSSILLKELRIKNDLVYKTTCNLFTNFCGSGCEIYISTLDENILKVLDIVFKLIKKYKKKLVSVKQISYVKNKHLVKFYNKNLNNTDKLSSFFGLQFLFQLNKINKNIYSYNDYSNLIKNISQKKIKELFNEIFNTEQCIVCYMGKNKVNFSDNDY